jgi:hypothetical protein
MLTLPASAHHLFCGRRGLLFIYYYDNFIINAGILARRSGVMPTVS